MFSIEYKRMNNCTERGELNTPSTKYTRYGGDTATNRVNITEFDWTQTGVPPGSVSYDMHTYYVSFPSQDSSVNFEFKHGASTPIDNNYFQYRPNANLDYVFDSFGSYIKRKTFDIDGERLSTKPEIQDYNNSFSFLDGIQIEYPLPFAYQYCNLCVENHPYRIYYSEKDTQETLEDKARIVLANNYMDLNGLSGEITDLFVNFDNLYATTLNSNFLIPTNPQVFQTDIGDVYIGTGQVLSIPAKELKNTSYAFGGQQYFKSRVSTEYGTFFVDSLSKRPFLLSNTLEDLSLMGMRNFWQENGDVKFLDQFFQITGEKFPFKSTSALHGVGYISTYDPRYKRIIVHKRDFKLRSTNKFYYVPLATDIPLNSTYIPVKSTGFNGFNFYYNNASGVAELIDFDRIDFFENLSFTLSYSFLTKHWASFHSYLPNYIFNTSETFFSVDNNRLVNDIFAHNATTHQTYYDTKYPHIIDLIIQQNPFEQKTSSSVIITNTAYLKDPQTNYLKVIPKTYTGLIGYNSKQTTGYQDLVVADQAFQTDNISNIVLTKSTDHQWRLNNLRDLTIDNAESIWDFTWAAKATTPYNYIDKVPNLANIDYDKSLFETARLKDHYLGLRLFLNSPDDYKLVTDLVTGTTQNKNR